MVNLVTELSKYLMILLMTLYTYYNFRFFGVKSLERKNKICRKQNWIMFTIHFLAYLLMYLRTEEPELISFYLMQVVFFIGYLIIYRMAYKNISRLLFNNSCMLLSVGFIILTRLSMDKAYKQFIIAAVSAAVTLIIPYLIKKVKVISEIPWFYCGVGIVLLLAVLILGGTTYGAQISLSIGGISLQPTEFAKISFVFFVAALLAKSTDFKNIVITTGLAAVHVVILVLSKELGGALIFFLTYISVLFVATGQYLYFFGGLLAGSGAAVLAYQLFAHVRVRVTVWRDPWTDITNTGWQITQSLFAIGTGGWFGMGIFQGMPEKIPVVEKDFVFAAISEELGGIFALCLILVCLGCFLQFLLISTETKEDFYKLTAFGLAMIYIVQVFLTIGGVTKFIPLTGVTLPLVSYGGSSIVSTFIMFGILQGIYIKNREAEKYEQKKEIENK